MNTNKTLTQKEKKSLGIVEFAQYCADQTASRLKRDSKTLSALRTLAAGIDVNPFWFSSNPRHAALADQIRRLLLFTLQGRKTLLSDFVKRIPADELHFQDSRRIAKVVLNIE